MIRWFFWLLHRRWHRDHLRAYVFFVKPTHRRLKLVNPINTTAPVQAVVVLQDNGTTVSPISVAWSSSDSTIAAVDASSGVVTPVAPGAAIISALCTFANASGDTLSVIGSGTVTVTAIGDNLVATVDFQPISTAPAAPAAAA
jgi:hypothetical protein